MASSFFRYLDCTNPQKDNDIQKNQILSPDIINTKTLITQKLAYSLKRKKYVKKCQNLNHSLRNINPKIKSLQDHKELIFSDQNTNNRFLISKQFSYTIHPILSKLKKSMSTNSSSMVGLPLHLSRQNSFQQDILRSTQETQLCGAQSTVDQSKRDFQRNTRNKEVQDQGSYRVLPDRVKENLVSPKRNNIGEDELKKPKLLSKGRSEVSLLRLGLGLKRQCSSTLERNMVDFDLIQEEQQDKSPTLYEAIRKIDEESVFEEKIIEEPSMIQSVILVQINCPKKKLEHLEIRSTCSIKESSSGDEFSEVIDGSGLSMGKRKFSLAQNLFKEFL